MFGVGGRGQLPDRRQLHGQQEDLRTGNKYDFANLIRFFLFDVFILVKIFNILVFSNLTYGQKNNRLGTLLPYKIFIFQIDIHPFRGRTMGTLLERLD